MVHQQQSSRIIIMCPHYDFDLFQFIYMENIIYQLSTT